MTHGFKLEIRAAGGRDVEVQRFARLPIAIGRHSDNDLKLERLFVSTHHARIDEVRGRLAVIDLGSTNGVSVQSAPGGARLRLPSRASHDLAASGFEFFIGEYSIRVLRESEQAAPAAVSVLPSLPDLPVLGAYPAGELPSLDLPAPPRAAVHAARPVAPAEPRPRRHATPEAAALDGLRGLARALIPGVSLDTPVEVERFVERLQRAVELLCRGVVELRAGQARSISSLRLGPSEEAPSGRSAIELDDPLRVAAQLLETSRPLAEVSQALEAALHQLVAHEVALLDGVIQGVSALLGEIAPERIEAESGRESFVKGIGNRARSYWRAYGARHAELSRGDAGLAIVFGRAFTQAYTAYRGAARREAPRSARAARNLA
jgi:type VI secretion system protein ImpI